MYCIDFLVGSHMIFGGAIVVTMRFSDAETHPTANYQHHLLLGNSNFTTKRKAAIGQQTIANTIQITKRNKLPIIFLQR
jgi:hypothetical protein